MQVLIIAVLAAGALGVFGGLTVGDGLNDLKNLTIILSLMYFYFKFFHKGGAW
ncbi:hypothetical protein [Thaumasiovibrio subtropicus]|uniref:hypothetical protein n=1 Tax=Thaumasiovibrio subtropicus TaxID=1891207 RepID=UPI00131BD01E|nr:hypothetical protein [Thaumasiovibrio subtropicus]